MNEFISAFDIINMEQLSSIKEIGNKFLHYSEIFPEDIISLSDEIKNIENHIQLIFNEDLKQIKKQINENRLRLCINYKNFENIEYLLSTSLYPEKDIPECQGQIIRFYLANLYICKNVMISIIKFINSTLINRIEESLKLYKNKQLFFIYLLIR